MSASNTKLTTRRLTWCVAVALAAVLAAATVMLASPLRPASAAPAGFSPRGIALQGQTLFGASTGGPSQDPILLESAAGARLGIHRTYWSSAEVRQATRRARADVAAGRLPWISFKAPYGWAEMASGRGDQWARDAAAALATVQGPVWLAIHHEPEGDGDLAAWRSMQQRLSPLFRASPNIGYTVILTGWHQFMSPARDKRYSMQSLWPGPRYVDVTGFDIYNMYGTVDASGQSVSEWREIDHYVAAIRAWSASVGGAKWALAETGLTNVAGRTDATWLKRTYDDVKAAGGLAVTYFDHQLSHEDPSWTWRLSGPKKLAVFARVLRRADRMYPAAPLASVALVRTNRSASKLRVNVNPNKGHGYWRFRVQQQRANGSWGTRGKVFRTRGAKETRTVNLPRGRYRVVVLPKYGLAGTTSAAISLRR